MRSAQEWNFRFTQQARWTEQVRRVLFDGLGLTNARLGLEVGSGTGVVSEDMRRRGQAVIHGIDLRWDFLHFAHGAHPRLRLAQADAFHLPFREGMFDFTFCHYFLLWAANPRLALVEMQRVTRPGGVVLALAEPDYGGRIDFPAELTPVGQMQSRALRQQGANPDIGRSLAHLFHASGFTRIQSGVLGGQWGAALPADELDAEWKILADDLAGLASLAELQAYHERDAAAWQAGERILYIPTFYAWGYVPGLPPCG